MNSQSEPEGERPVAQTLPPAPKGFEYYEVSPATHSCVPIDLQRRLDEIFDEQDLPCGQHRGVFLLEGFCPRCPERQLEAEKDALRCDCCSSVYEIYSRPEGFDIRYESPGDKADECVCEVPSQGHLPKVHFWTLVSR